MLVSITTEEKKKQNNFLLSKKAFEMSNVLFIAQFTIIYGY